MLNAPQTTDRKPTNGHSRSIPLDQLTLVHHAFQELAHCDSLEEVKDIRNKADAVRRYARNAKAGLELQNKAAQLKLHAERRAGELLRAMNLRGGDRVSDLACGRATLERLDISQNQSTRWQKLATIPEEEFSKFLASAHNSDAELTTACLLRRATSLANKRATTQDLNSVLPNCMTHRSTDATSPEEVIVELLSHCQVLENILSQIYDREGPVEIPSGERRHLRRLVRDLKTLLTDLQERVPGTMKP